MKKLFITILALVIVIAFSCSKHDKDNIKKSEECIECKSGGTDLSLGQLVPLTNMQDSTLNVLLSSSEYTNYNADNFGNLSGKAIQIANIEGSRGKFICISLKESETHSIWLYAYMFSEGIQVYVQELKIDGTNLIDNKYDIEGTLWISAKIDITTGRYLDLWNKAIRAPVGFWYCMQTAMAACMADPVCSTLCLGMNVGCVGSMAAACAYTSTVNNN